MTHSPLEKLLLNALTVTIREYKAQVRLALQLGGDLAINQNNIDAFRVAAEAIAEAKRAQ